MSKSKTKMRFETIKARDGQLKKFAPGSYKIDKKDPLVVYLNL